jgi:hypothetical protein
MKKLFFLLAVLGSLSASAQINVDVFNNTSVDVEVRIHYFNSSSCVYQSFDTYTIPSGTTWLFNAPAGYEYTYLDFASALGVCSPGFSGTVGTPSTPGCYGSCTYAGPSSYLGPTNGCGGQTWVTARWTNCAGVDLGYVSIDDF